MNRLQREKPARLWYALVFFLPAVLCLFPFVISLSGQTVETFQAEISDVNYQMLKILYREAFENASQVTLDFIKNEYHVDVDGRAANKEEHVVFLCYDCPEGMRFLVQVTYFQLVGHDVVVKYADQTKKIRCTVEDSTFSVEETSYSDKEMRPLLKTLIQRVKEENELLRMYPVKK